MARRINKHDNYLMSALERIAAMNLKFKRRMTLRHFADRPFRIHINLLLNESMITVFVVVVCVADFYCCCRCLYGLFFFFFK